jgi:hypothetical protein
MLSNRYKFQKLHVITDRRGENIQHLWLTYDRTAIDRGDYPKAEALMQPLYERKLNARFLKQNGLRPVASDTLHHDDEHINGQSKVLHSLQADTLFVWDCRRLVDKILIKKDRVGTALKLDWWISAMACSHSSHDYQTHSECPISPSSTVCNKTSTGLCYSQCAECKIWGFQGGDYE